MGGGQKFLIRRLQVVGRQSVVRTKPGRMVTQLTAGFYAGGSNPGRPTVVGGAAAMVGVPVLQPPTKKSQVGFITICPLLALLLALLPTAWIRTCH